MQKCECSDPDCPWCSGDCDADATDCLYRIDQQDGTGTMFCLECAEDAWGSGLYSAESPDDREQKERYYAENY